MLTTRNSYSHCWKGHWIGAGWVWNGTFKAGRLVCKPYGIIQTSFEVHVPGGVEVIEYSVTFSGPYLIQFFTALQMFGPFVLILELWNQRLRDSG